MNTSRTMRACALAVSLIASAWQGAVARTPNDQLVIGVSMNNLLSLDPAGATGNDVVEIASVLLTLLGLLFLTFVIGRVMPLDPVLSIVGPDADRSTYNQVRQQLGLDRPLVVQFGYYLRDLSHADLGKALLTGHPVRDDLARVLPPMAGEWEVFASALRFIALPAGILGLHAVAYISRMSRSFMLAQLSQEYVLTARVKGLSETAVVWRHAFRNILVQLLTVVALSYGGLLEGAVLIETVFGWPGFGQYLTSSLLLGDMNAVMGSVLVVGIVFVALNLLSDALYQVFDPRTRP